MEQCQAANLKYIFIYIISISIYIYIHNLFIWKSEITLEGIQSGAGEGKAGFPLSREPDVGLDWDQDLSQRQTHNDQITQMFLKIF